MAWARHVQNCQHASGPVPKATMRWLAGPEPCREDPDECSARIRCPDLICRCCQFSCAMTMSCFLETFNLDFLFRLFWGQKFPQNFCPELLAMLLEPKVSFGIEASRWRGLVWTHHMEVFTCPRPSEPGVDAAWSFHTSSSLKCFTVLILLWFACQYGQVEMGEASRHQDWPMNRWRAAQLNLIKNHQNKSVGIKKVVFFPYVCTWLSYSYFIVIFPNSCPDVAGRTQTRGLEHDSSSTSTGLWGCALGHPGEVWEVTNRNDKQKSEFEIEPSPLNHH